MRIQAFDARSMDGAWQLERNRHGRLAAGSVGLVFGLIALLLFVTQAGAPWRIATSSGALVIAVVLMQSALVREDMTISRSGILYSRGLVSRTRREHPLVALEGIYHGPNWLLLGHRRIPAYRVWIDFTDTSLPRCVVFEQKTRGGTEAQRRGEALAREMAKSLSLSPIFRAA